MTPTKAASTLLTTNAIIVHDYAFSVQPLLSLHRGLRCSGGLVLIMVRGTPITNTGPKPFLDSLFT
jgi:hypothetical protein